MNIELSATVSRADGTLLYKQTHSIPEATPEQASWIQDALTKANDHATKVAAAKKEDDDSYTAQFNASVDGTAQPEVRFDGVSYNAVVKQAQYWQKNVLDEVLKAGEKVAKQKEKDAR